MCPGIVKSYKRQFICVYSRHAHDRFYATLTSARPSPSIEGGGSARWQSSDCVSVSVGQRMYVVVKQKSFVVDAAETFLDHFARRYHVPVRSERAELARRLTALIEHAKVIFVSDVFLDI